MLTLAFLATGAGVSGLRAQDRLVFKDNPGPHPGRPDHRDERQHGPDQRWRPRPAPARWAFDLGLIARIDSSPPAAFQALGPPRTPPGNGTRRSPRLSNRLVDTPFTGCPTDWERQAIGMLGDIYIEKERRGREGGGCLWRLPPLLSRQHGSARCGSTWVRRTWLIPRAEQRRAGPAAARPHPAGGVEEARRKCRQPTARRTARRSTFPGNSTSAREISRPRWKIIFAR